jgi:hypothetical protein
MVYAAVSSGDVCSLCIGGFSHYEVRYEVAEREYIKDFQSGVKVGLCCQYWVGVVDLR